MNDENVSFLDYPNRMCVSLRVHVDMNNGRRLPHNGAGCTYLFELSG